MVHNRAVTVKVFGLQEHPPQQLVGTDQGGAVSPFVLQGSLQKRPVRVVGEFTGNVGLQQIMIGVEVQHVLAHVGVLPGGEALPKDVMLVTALVAAVGADDMAYVMDPGRQVFAYQPDAPVTAQVLLDAPQGEAEFVAVLAFVVIGNANIYIHVTKLKILFGIVVIKRNFTEWKKKR